MRRTIAALGGRSVLKNKKKKVTQLKKKREEKRSLSSKRKKKVTQHKTKEKGSLSSTVAYTTLSTQPLPQNLFNHLHLYLNFINVQNIHCFMVRVLHNIAYDGL